MQQFPQHSTIVSETSLQAVLGEIRDGVTYGDFWLNRYTEESDLEEEPQVEGQEPGVEVAQ